MMHKRPRQRKLRGAVLLEAMLAGVLLAVGLSALLTPIATLSGLRSHQRYLAGAVSLADSQLREHRPSAIVTDVPVSGALVSDPGYPTYAVDVRRDAIGPVGRQLVRISATVKWNEGIIGRSYSLVTHVVP
jgi:hypothetical protein